MSDMHACTVRLCAEVMETTGSAGRWWSSPAPGGFCIIFPSHITLTQSDTSSGIYVAQCPDGTIASGKLHDATLGAQPARFWPCLHKLHLRYPMQSCAVQILKEPFGARHSQVGGPKGIFPGKHALVMRMHAKESSCGPSWTARLGKIVYRILQFYL